jgi:hypothetical protein
MTLLLQGRMFEQKVIHDQKRGTFSAYTTGVQTYATQKILIDRRAAAVIHGTDTPELCTQPKYINLNNQHQCRYYL